MTDEKTNTINRDRDYGAAGNASYEQFKIATAYRIACAKKSEPSGDLEALYKTLMEKIDNPMLFGVIPIKALTDANQKAGSREGVEDAFLIENINTAGFRSNTKSPTR